MKRDQKSAMIRVGMRDDEPVLDAESRLGGRGGYLHASLECAERFVKSKVKEYRSLRRGIDRQRREQIADAVRARLDRGRAVE